MRFVAVSSIVVSAFLPVVIAARRDHAPQPQPTIFIALGPTGTGKSSVERVLGDLWALRGDDVSHDDPAMLLVDDLVEKDAGYVAAISQLLSTLKNSPAFQNKGTQQKTVETWVEKADAKTYKQFADAYFEGRNHGCSKPKDGGCNAVFDSMVNDAFVKKRSMMFETTGISDIEWIVSKARQNHYKVVLAVAAAPFCDVQRRIRSRAVSSIETFLNQKGPAKGPAPRLPDVTALGDTVSRIIDKALGYLDCLVPVTNGSSCKFGVDEIHVFSTKELGFTPDVVMLAPARPKTEKQVNIALADLKNQAKELLHLLQPQKC